MIKKEFLELLKRLKTERLLSSEADNLFGRANGDRYSLNLKFLQFSSVFGRQIDSEYDNGYKFECIIEEDLDVVVLFKEECKDLVESLSNQSAQEFNVKVLGYDSLYQKPILGYFEGEINEQELEAEVDILPKSEPHQWEGYKQRGREQKETSVEEQKRLVVSRADIWEQFEEKTKKAGNPSTERPINCGHIAILLFFVLCVPIFIFFSNSVDQGRAEGRKALQSYRESKAKDVVFNEWEKNLYKAHSEYGRGELSKARQFILRSLNVINKKGAEESKSRIQTMTYQSYYLLGQIYDRAGDSYKSCMSLLKARDQKESNIRDVNSINKIIDKKFLKLKEYGMGGLIDETQKTLNPVNQEWLDSVISIAVDDSLIKVGVDGGKMILIKTNEPYSGWSKSFHESGSIKDLIHLDQGQRHGHYRSWKIDGSVASIATYNKGKKTGLNPTFGDDGNAYNIPMYKDGKLLNP